jgi:PAS domain S-box-containing protein
VPFCFAGRSGSARITALARKPQVKELAISGEHRGPDRAATTATAGDGELDALRSIVEGTARGTGEAFFESLVRHLAAALHVQFAFVAEFCGEFRARTLAYWRDGNIVPNVEWDVRGTPCEDVVKGTLCHYPDGVAQRFPADEPMVRMSIRSYLGVPLLAPDGRHLGHLAVFDRAPLPDEPRKLFIFRIFAARAAAEFDRLRYEKMLAESEHRFRDLYEEAPIAYIYEEITSRFVYANRAAIRLLGLKPDEVAGTMGLSLIPDTPDAQARVKKVIGVLQSGEEQACVELELRRKDDGRPIFVQWWSKPEPDGKHTRTMLIDVTQRVLMEREKARLEAQNQYLREEINDAHNFEEIVGRSPALLAVLENVRRVAPTDASVLIWGETGTGKELIARAIHSGSKRRDKPLIKVNCAALPGGLVESELFGHERGAFSGAIAKRIGRFELADGGTIFLDEVGEIPLDVQAKLLRVLQEREFERVGGGTSIRVDVRVVAATNRDLLRAVREGKFREDLYYRLNVFPLTLPPLRERSDDVPLLVQFFVNKHCGQLGKRIDRVSPATMRLLESYRWPGNIRELENVLERAVILETDPTLEIPPDLLGAQEQAKSATTPTTSGIPPAKSLETIERNHILSVLEETGWVIDGSKGAAKILNLHPNTLRSRLKKMGITRRESHEPS